MVISVLADPGLRTVSVDFSGLLLTTVPSQRASFATLSLGGASCANTAVESGNASTDTNSSKGVTSPWRLTLSDGTLTHDASFQAIDEHKANVTLASGRTEMNFVDSYKYNIAAYALAELLGLDDMLPVYVERSWQGNSGSLSWWLPVKMDEADRVKQKIAPPDPDAWDNQMHKIRVFDQLVYDDDPNLTNYLPFVRAGASQTM